MLIVGGGNVAADRLRSVLPTDAKVTVICPEDGMGEEVSFRVREEGARWGLEWRNRNFEDSDIENEVSCCTFESRHVYLLANVHAS